MITKNSYSHKFVAVCPSDGEKIVYSITITTEKMIMVEDIRRRLSLINTGYQETIADELFEHFGGRQVIEAEHQGVKITTERKGRHE